MKISIANTESARTEAQSLMNSKNSLNSILTTLKYTQNILGQIWKSGTEIESINTTVSGLSSSLSGKLNLSGGTMTGALIAQSNTNYTTGQVRNIYLSMEAPTNDVGSNGDIWIVYGG